MKAYLGYALVGAGVVALLAGMLGWLLGPVAARSIWWAAAVAYGLQLIAFAALLAYRKRTQAFLTAWGAGILARMAIVLVGAWWVMRSEVLEPAPALLGLAGFLFVVLLLEPVFFIVGQRDG